MKFTIIIPHYKNAKTTAYSVAQFLKFKGRHDVKIIVINNSFSDDSIKGLEPFKDEIIILDNTSDKISSHGIALDLGMETVETEWVITAESDSFPTSENWLDYYVRLINEGYDGAGSLLQLSGGKYIHPAGALYKWDIWRKASDYCNAIEYHYFPNMSMRESFACHTMIHHSILKDFLNSPEDYIELSDSYRGLHMLQIMDKCKHYKPVVGPFHNGMGRNDESIYTYGKRTMESEALNILLDNKKKIVNRIGAEPGQWLAWWQKAMGYKIFEIPTKTFWLPGKENQQQGYTINEAGFIHIWAGSSYLDMKGTGQNDVYEFKKNQIEQLYNSLPEHQKIKE